MAEAFHIAPGLWAICYFVSAALVLSFVTLMQARGRGTIRRPLLWLLVVVATSLFGWGWVRGAVDARAAIWGSRFTISIGSWSGPAAVAFAAALLDDPRPRLFRFALWAAGLSTLLAMFTPWVVTGARLGTYGQVANTGPLYLLLLLELTLTLVLPVMIIRRLPRETRPLSRRRLQIVLITNLLGAIAFVDVAGPLGLDAPPIGWLPLDVASTLLLFGVVRYRLLDVRLAAWRLLLWLLLTAAGALPFVALAATVVHIAPPRSVWEAAFLAAGLAAGLRAYLEGVQPRVDALVGQRRRDLAVEMTALESQLGTLQTLTALGQAVDRFLGALDRRLAALVVIDTLGRPQLALSAWGAVPVPTRDSPLLHELQRARAPISVDEVRGPARLEIERACVRWGAEYLGPLVDGEQLLGLLAISPRQHGGAARIEEVEALDRVCVVVTAALASARLYERLHALSAELEHKAQARSSSLERALGDLRGAEVRLLASEKLATLGQIVAGVAADLRDQVSTVFELAKQLRADSEVLRQAGDEARRSVPDDPIFDDVTRDLQPLLDSVGEGARRASAIAQDLYGFAPADRRERAVERRPMPLASVVDSTLTLLGAQLRDITIDRQYDEALPDVPVEPGPMGQVVLNLVLNAAQAMQGRGRLTVGTRANGASAELWVADSGPGIPPEVMARIFEPFYTTKGPSHGTGLGLSVSFGIVARHGGRILVDSAPGAGCTFRVQLPLA